MATPAVARCRYIVVLGSGNGDLPGLPATSELCCTAIARLVEAVRILRLLPQAELIVSGPAPPPHSSHAQVLADAAVCLGIDRARIHLIDHAHDTEEESVAVRAFVHDAPVGVVTTAWHMPRAMTISAGPGSTPWPARPIIPPGHSPNFIGRALLGRGIARAQFPRRRPRTGRPTLAAALKEKINFASPCRGRTFSSLADSMLSLKKLLGRDDRFFDLLEAGAEEAKASVDIFGRYLQSLADGGSPVQVWTTAPGPAQRKAHQPRDAGGAEPHFRHSPGTRGHRGTVLRALPDPQAGGKDRRTHLDLSRADPVQEAFLRRPNCWRAVETGGLHGQAAAAWRNIEKIREANDRLQFVEGEADKSMLGAAQGTLSQPGDAKELMILQEIYEMIEQAVDRCRNAGNIVGAAR